jgi:acyl carrier protein
MVPSVVMVLAGLPLTVNGKLDRAALPEPDYQTAAADTGYGTPAEELLAQLFAEVLGLDRVGADDSFFDLGGHSMMAAKLASRIRSVLGMEAELQDVFEAPTVAKLTARLAASTGRRARPVLRPMRRPDSDPDD